MNYALHPADFPTYHAEVDKQEGGPDKPGVLRRLYQALYASCQRETDRQIASFVARSGGRFTDEFERELSMRVATGDWQTRSPNARF